MNILRRIGSISLLLCFGSATAQNQADGELHIQADTPIVNIEKRDGGRNFLQLPSLTYELEIAKKCGGDLRPAVLSLAVADTRRSFQADDISADDNLPIRFAVPAAQIGPIPVESFCANAESSEGEDRPNAPESMTVPAVLSLQASLLCTSEIESRMTYASTSLDVTLECTDPEKSDSGSVD
ncbi:MAG: hypothetical protein ACR2Q3_08930 [Woeseiaceae bacterium]